MQNPLTKKPVAAILAIVVLAGGGLVGYKLTAKTTSSVTAAPTKIAAAPAGLIGGTAPDATSQLWELVNMAGRANVQLANISITKPLAIYPVSNAATSITTVIGQPVAVGLGTATAGAVKFYTASTFHLIATTPTSGPVVALAADSGSNYYALTSHNGVSAVNVISIASHQITSTIPMPAGTLSIAVSADGSIIYGLQGNGTVSLVNTITKKVTQSFNTSGGARQIALSPDGTTLYELKGSLANDNVGVINLTTESQKYVLPAPASTVQVQVTPSGASLFDLVGNPQYGNIQVYSTSK